MPDRPPPCTPGELPPIGTHHLAAPDAAKDGTKDAPAAVSTASDTPTPSDSAKPTGDAADPDPKAAAVAEGGPVVEGDPEAEGDPDPEGDPDAEDDPDPEGDPVASDDADPVASDDADPVASDDVDPVASDDVDPDPDPDGPPTPSADDPLAAFEAARDDMERSADWLLCVVPYQLPDEDLDAWVERRDLVMDWIEYHPTLGYTFNASVMAPIHKDRKFSASMYMNVAYAIGKARYLLSATPPDPIEAEVAALDTVVRYYVTFTTAEPKLRARKLARLMRKKKRGKLRPWIAKRMTGG